MNRVVAVITLGILMGCLVVAPRSALAYNGPAMKVTANQPGSTGYANRDLWYAVDASASTCATIGTYGAWAEWQFADGQPRFVTRVRLVVGEIHSPTIRVSGPEGTYQVPASTLELKFPEPTPILGFRVQSPPSGFTQSICDVQFDFVTVDPPGTPVNLRVEEARHDRVVLAWDAPSDGGGVTGYTVYRDGELVAVVADTVYVDEAVQVGMNYSYEVVAYGTYGQSDPAGPVTVTVPPPEAPGMVHGLRLMYAQPHEVRIAWDAPSAGGPVTEYRVLRNGQLVAVVSDTEYTDGDVEPQTTYVYTVVAVGPGGAAPESEVLEVSVPEVPTEPPGPIQAARSRAGARSVQLLWAPPVSGGPVREYFISRDGVLLGRTSSTTWTDSSVEPEMEYQYEIVAVNELGASDPVTLSVRTPSPGLLDGASPGVSGLGRQVGAGLMLLLNPFLVAAGLILARIITTRGVEWLGVWRRG